MNRRDYLLAFGATLAGTRSSLAAEPTASAPAILGPDPDTYTPKFKPPPLACDTHTHIFGPDATDRVVWGSDWPHPNLKVMPNDGDLVDLIPAFAPSADLQMKLRVDNPARLYRF